MRHAAVALVLLCAALPARAQLRDDKEKADGFVALFDGKSLDGWKVYDGKPEVWTAEDGLARLQGRRRRLARHRRATTTTSCCASNIA